MLKVFLSTLSLRRATTAEQTAREQADISIHALLAESDLRQLHRYCHAAGGHFYPRSPCGERPSILHKILADWDFYPRSPCGERHFVHLHKINMSNFYPRSPCGERP